MYLMYTYKLTSDIGKTILLGNKYQDINNSKLNTCPLYTQYTPRKHQF